MTEEGLRIGLNGRSVVTDYSQILYGAAGTALCNKYPRTQQFASASEVDELKEHVKELQHMVRAMWDHPLMPGGQHVLRDFENEQENTN